MIPLVAAGVGVAFLPQWVEFMPKQNFCLKRVRGIDMRISLGLTWNESDPRTGTKFLRLPVHL